MPDTNSQPTVGANASGVPVSPFPVPTDTQVQTDLPTLPVVPSLPELPIPGDDGSASLPPAPQIMSEQPLPEPVVPMQEPIPPIPTVSEPQLQPTVVEQVSASNFDPFAMPQVTMPSSGNPAVIEPPSTPASPYVASSELPALETTVKKPVRGKRMMVNLAIVVVIVALIATAGYLLFFTAEGKNILASLGIA